MVNVEPEFRVNDQGMIVEETVDLEIEDVIRSTQEIDEEREKFVFEREPTAS